MISGRVFIMSLVSRLGENGRAAAGRGNEEKARKKGEERETDLGGFRFVWDDEAADGPASRTISST